MTPAGEASDQCDHAEQVTSVSPCLLCLVMTDTSQEPSWEAQDQAIPCHGSGNCSERVTAMLLYAGRNVTARGDTDL